MPSTRVKEKLAADITSWQLDGIIDDDKRSLLATRYDTAGWNLGVAIKYVGIAGAILSGLGLLGATAAATGSAAFGALLLVGVGAGLLFAGFSLARDARARYTGSSKVVLAIGLFALAGAVVLAAKSADANDSATLTLLGVLLLPLTLVLSYSQRSAFLLFVFVVGLFHWLAAWSIVVGHSSSDALDLRVLVGVAIAVFALGVWHERLSASGWPRFDLVYEAAALIYLNLALLGLCLERNHELGFVAALALGAVGQVALGATLKNSLTIGFGVAAAAVLMLDLYCDHYWRAWGENDQGLFLLVGGVLLLAMGWLAESGLRILQRRSQSG